MRPSVLLPFACALTLTFAVGCTAEPASEPQAEPAAPSEPSPPPAPEPPPPADVAGTLEELTVTDLSITGSGLYPAGSDTEAPVEPDQDAIDAAVDAANAWIDDHLTRLQLGEDGGVSPAGLDGDATSVGPALADPDHHVTAARYVVTVGARGAPEWVRVSATVERADGTATATFVFLPDDDEVTLVAAQAGGGTPVPSAETAP